MDMRKNLPAAMFGLLSRAAALLRWHLWVGLGALTLVAACGGGTRTIDPFVPNRVVAFGDETSSVGSDGTRYMVNDLSSGTLDCTKNPLWIQQLATSLAVPLSACPGTSTTATSLTRAAPLARVADMVAQVDAFVQTDTLGDKDLVTMSVGMHDVLAAYATASSVDEATLVAGLQASGKAFGQQVNRVAARGAPVLVLTVYDLGLTPYGRAQETAVPGRAALLRRLTSAFNIAMRLEIINDGRLVGLVDNFDLVNAMVRLPQVYTLTNITDAVCAAAMPGCGTDTLLQINGADVPYSFYLWADDLRLGPVAHVRLGQLAEGRARNNPF